MRAIKWLVTTAAVVIILIVAGALVASWMVQELGVDWTPLREFVDWVRDVWADRPWADHQMEDGVISGG